MEDGAGIHIVIAILSLISCLIFIIPYWIKRNHYLINYYGFKLNFGIGLLTAFTMVLNALCYAFNLPCLCNAIITAFGSSISIALQTGRYVRYILMNKANIMKEGLLRMNQNNSSNQVLEESNNNIFLNPNVKEGSDSGFDINFEKNINKKYLKPLYIIYAVIITSSFVLSIVLNKDMLFESCREGALKIFIPVIATVGILTIFMPFILMYTFKNLSKDKRVDVLMFLLFSAFAGLIFTLAKVGVIKSDCSHYAFYFSYFSNVLTCLGIPLYTVYKASYKTTQKKTKEEFIKLLFDKNFIILLKDQSVQLFCIENVLFWEAHQMLMTIVFDFYSASNSEKKKNKIIQKKNVVKDNYPNSFKVGSVSKGDSIVGSQISSVMDEHRLSIENIDSINSENIDIVINKDDTKSMATNTLKQDIYNNAVINFINENNITFFDENTENEADYNTKIEYVYKLLFKEYSQNANIKLTKKELTIDSFLIYDQLTKYFQKVYDTFIDPNGISPLNVSNTVIEEVRHSIQNNTYPHTVYKHVLSEVIDMMYYNVYMNSIKKMSLK